MYGQVVKILALDDKVTCVKFENSERTISLNKQAFKEKIMSGEYILPCLVFVN